jgi:hypothetical protein
MDITPQSMRSPISLYDQQSKQSFSSQRPCYPATPQPEPQSMEEPNRGLGIDFECPIPTQSTVQELPPSPQPSDSWSHSSMMDQDYSQTFQPPDISSAAFDPFSGYSNGANNTMMTTQSPEAPGLVFCHTPPSTNMPSHRSSISSSYSPSETYSEHGTQYYTPRVKQEDSHEWYPAPGNEQVLHRSLTTQGLTPYSNGVSPINGPSEDFYIKQPGDWSKQSSGYPTEFHNPLSEEARSKFDAAPVLLSVNRIKKKRQRTTPEEATHECRVCGKLFKRSYNWKSHMETHNPERKYPHPCTHVIGNQPCTKKFQRKTDLDRHVDSVSPPSYSIMTHVVTSSTGPSQSSQPPLQPMRQPLRSPRHTQASHRRRLPKAIRDWLPRRLGRSTSTVVIQQLPSARQILQSRNVTVTIDGATDVCSAIVYIPYLPKA